MFAIKSLFNGLHTAFGYVFLQSSVLGSGGIMYINGRIVSGPLDSLVEALLPKNVVDLDKVSLCFNLNTYKVI